MSVTEEDLQNQINQDDNTSSNTVAPTQSPYEPPEMDTGGLLDASVEDINTLTSQNNPLMQQATTEGKQFANERGLLNSSMAGGYVQQARLKEVMPLVTQNAKTRGQGLLDDRRSAYDAWAQENQQTFQAGESALGREQELTLQERDTAARMGLSEQEYQQQLAINEQANTFMTARDEILQAFEASQSALDREQGLTMQANEIAAAMGLSEQEYLQQMSLAEQSQAWQSSEAALGREQQLTMQDREIAAAMGLSEQEFLQQTQLVDQANQFTTQRDQVLQDFEAGQSALDREQGITMQANEIAAAMGLSEQEYQQQSALADQANEFTAEQTALARQQEIDMLNLDTESRASLIDLEQQWNALMTNNQALADVWVSNIEALGEVLSAGLTEEQTSAALDYYLGPLNDDGARDGGVLNAGLSFVSGLNTSDATTEGTTGGTTTGGTTTDTTTDTTTGGNVSVTTNEQQDNNTYSTDLHGGYDYNIVDGVVQVDSLPSGRRGLTVLNEIRDAGYELVNLT